MEEMLGFKRICVDAWQGFVRLACNVLMQVNCNSGFLLMGEEMHLIASIILFICVNRSSPHFALLALAQTPSVLALVASLAFDHSDHEMISPIRVIA